MTKFAVLGCIAILAALDVHARDVYAGKSNRDELLLRLQVENIDGQMLFHSMADVATIFKQISVKVRWTQTGNREERNRQLATCSSRAVDVSVIDILIQQRTRASDHPGALAYSMPFAKSGFRVVVFYDRVVAAISPSSPHLLGHVIAHEVGHMVIGTSAHSPQGLMTAHWSGNELDSMQIHPIWFTADDATMIHRRIDQQREHCFTLSAR
jgi:hypothetical protein